MATGQHRFPTVFTAAILLILFAICAAADAADRPNRASSQDIAAGRWMDSLLDPDSKPQPLLQKKRRSHQRSSARGNARKRTSNLRGKLVKNPKTDDGSPPFALVDQHGGILRYVEPVKSVELKKYLGKTIGVRRDTGDILLASQLALPRSIRGTSTDEIQLAQNLEPIPAGEPLPAGEVVGESTPITGDDSGPVYLDDGYDDGLNFGGCPTCGDVTCGGCVRGGPCGFGARGLFYAHAEYLLWDMEGMNTPPLVTQVPFDTNNFMPIGDAVTLFGDRRVLDDERNGGRFTFGYWLDDYGQWGIEGQYLFLDEETLSYSAGIKDGDFPQDGLFIFRPFFNTGIIDRNNDGIIDAGDLATRGRSLEDVDTNLLDGSVRVDIQSEFEAAGLLVRHNLCCRPGCCDPGCGDGVGCGSGVGCGGGCCGGVGCGSGVYEGIGPLRRLGNLLFFGTRRTDILFGIRWASLDESIQITEDLQQIVAIGTGPDQDVTLGQDIDVVDFFGTDNDFFGGEIGYETEWERNRWSLNLLTKIAIGNTRQRVNIQGSTVLDDGMGVVVVSNEGGLLAQLYNHPDGFTVGNIGVYERDEFSMIPEIGLTLGYNITPRLKVTGGYSLMYWSNVVRPGDQIDIDVNANLVPRDGGRDPDTIVRDDHPRFVFRQTDLWLQGLNFGAEYTW